MPGLPVNGNFTANQPNQQVGASSSRKVYTLAAFTGLSSLVPLGMLAKKGKDVFQKNGGIAISAVGQTLKKNPWTALTAVGLIGTGATLASANSVNSQIPVGDRVKALGAGMGTSLIATVPELGALVTGASIGCGVKDAFQANGRKIIPAVGTALKKNPVSALLFTGLAAASIWLEKKSSRFQDKAIAGKSET